MYRSYIGISWLLRSGDQHLHFVFHSLWNEGISENFDVDMVGL